MRGNVKCLRNMDAEDAAQTLGVYRKQVQLLGAGGRRISSGAPCTRTPETSSASRRHVVERELKHEGFGDLGVEVCRQRHSALRKERFVQGQRFRVGFARGIL